MELPKKVPLEQKEKWFQEFEKGSTVARLANYYKKDPRTIQRGIEEVRHRRLTTQVRIEMLKEGIRKHQDVLLDALAQAAEAIGPLPFHIDEIYRPTQTTLPIDLKGFHVHASNESYNHVELDIEGEFAWQLLGEHLGRDKVFTYLSRWKAAVIEELNLRLALKKLMLKRLTDELGLGVSEDPAQERALRPQALYELTRWVFSSVLGERPSYQLALKMAENGELYVSDFTGGRLPGGDRDSIRYLRRLPEDMAGKEQASELLRQHRAVADAAQRARQAFLEIRMSYYLPGSCSSCGRYGL